MLANIFITGTEIVPHDLKVRLQPRKSLLRLHPLRSKSHPVCSSEFLTTALEMKPGAAVAVEAPELLHHPL